MDATLTISDDTYHLDWNGNSLTDEPILVVNGEIGKRWSIFDILLDIFRNLSPKPDTLYFPANLGTEKKILRLFERHGSPNPWLDGHLLCLEAHARSDLKMGTCTVVNIGWG